MDPARTFKQKCKDPLRQGDLIEWREANTAGTIANKIALVLSVVDKWQNYKILTILEDNKKKNIYLKEWKVVNRNCEEG